ncbi:MAG: aldehyde dehydrogenase family protein [Holophagaceae bacterium]|nr:aldehyde dehydrogenase family protein [Holophagaceae bacterium]
MTQIYKCRRPGRSHHPPSAPHGPTGFQGGGGLAPLVRKRRRPENPPDEVARPRPSRGGPCYLPGAGFISPRSALFNLCNRWNLWIQSPFLALSSNHSKLRFGDRQEILIKRDEGDEDKPTSVNQTLQLSWNEPNVGGPVDPASNIPPAEFLRANVQAVFARQQEARWRIAATDTEERKAKLRRLLDALMERRGEAQAALAADFRKAPGEVDLTELYPVICEIKDALRNLGRWMKPRRVPAPLALLGSAGTIRQEPKGVVLIISPWNYPINLTLGPLVSAIAAGNCAMLKPSEHTPHTTAFIQRLLGDLFPEHEVAVVEGDAEAARALLELPFDHIFFTGSPAVGKLVMGAAALNLASVTLELGGKSPVLVDADADLREAARKIAWGKFLNAGQTCIAPDYVLAHAGIHDRLVQELKLAVESFYGADAAAWKQNPDLPRIVNAGHHARLKAVLEAAGGKVAVGGEVDSAENYMAPSILTDIAPDSPVMQQEIFGPILPVLKVADMDEAVRFVNARPKPLALYVFSGDRRAAESLLSRTTSGGACINDTVLHFAHMGLPGGGIGNSGFGKAHGHFGFEAFSNARGVLRQRTRFSAIQWMYPPYTSRVRKLIDLTLKYF